MKSGRDEIVREDGTVDMNSKRVLAMYEAVVDSFVCRPLIDEEHMESWEEYLESQRVGNSEG